VLAGGVAVDERQVLHGELRGVLVLAVRGGVALRRVARVHVEDAPLAAAAERHLAAAVEDDLRPVRLRIFAVAFMVIVIGSGPQLNVMMPPAATADTTASEVQLAALPLPTVRVGFDVSTARASAGIVALPFGLPACGPAAAGGLLLADADGAAEDAAGAALVVACAAATSLPTGVVAPRALPRSPAQPALAVSARRITSATRGLRCTARC
jgi:hypothetical protein